MTVKDLIDTLKKIRDVDSVVIKIGDKYFDVVDVVEDQQAAIESGYYCAAKVCVDTKK